MGTNNKLGTGQQQGWINSPGKEGVVYREHPTRKHGRRPDRYIAIRYRSGQGKRKLEALGWASDGWTLEKAVALLRELKENIRLGRSPQSLKEKRAMAESARIAAEQTAARARVKEISFGELAEHYRLWVRAHRISSQTSEMLLDDHILPVFGERIAAEITPPLMLTNCAASSLSNARAPDATRIRPAPACLPRPSCTSSRPCVKSSISRWRRLLPERPASCCSAARIRPS